MRLDQKYFVPFMIIGALVTMVLIVVSSLNFKKEQQQRFEDFANNYPELLTDAHPYVGQTDSLRLGELKGSNIVVVFWASWSEKSVEIFHELDALQNNYPETKIVAALVKDATETAEEVLPQHEFIYIDGTIMFNDLQVPGIPSYILIDSEGKVITTNVGYQEGVFEAISNQFAQ